MIFCLYHGSNETNLINLRLYHPIYSIDSSQNPTTPMICSSDPTPERCFFFQRLSKGPFWFWDPQTACSASINPPTWAGWKMNLMKIRVCLVKVMRMGKFSIAMFQPMTDSPQKINMEPKITQLKGKIIFQTIIFRFHVNLPGCWWFGICLGVNR